VTRLPTSLSIFCYLNRARLPFQVRTMESTVLPSQLSQLDLWNVAKQMKQELEIKDRIYLLKTYNACFLGSDAMAWLRSKFHNVEVRKIIMLMQ
jgi:hypothetical protein